MAALSDIRLRLGCRLRGGDATLWLIVVNVAVFAAAWIVDACLSGSPADTYLSLTASLQWTLYHPWTLFTYMVTHFSVLHLLFNMLWLYWFGTMSEGTVGPVRVLAAYGAGGLVGGALYLLIASLTGFIPVGSQLVGASASVLCIMTATALRTPDLEVNLLLAGPIRLKWFALLCILLAMLGLGGGNSGGVVAHIGGVVTGAVIGLSERGSLQRLEFKARLRINRRKVRRHHAGRGVAVAATPGMSAEERLDILLDKIKTSGYASLSTAERDELTRLSKEIK